MSELGKSVVENKVQELLANWNGVKSLAISDAKTAAVNFLVNSLDTLVTHVETNLSVSGSEKKLLVLEGLGKLYDAVGTAILPIYLRPFSGLIKRFLVNVALSYLIDFVVEKYNTGAWKQETTVAAQSIHSEYLRLEGVANALLREENENLKKELDACKRKGCC